MGGQDGIRTYYQGKIDNLEIILQDKTQNLRRLEAQRNDLNTKGWSMWLLCTFDRCIP